LKVSSSSKYAESGVGEIVLTFSISMSLADGSRTLFAVWTFLRSPLSKLQWRDAKYKIIYIKLGKLEIIV